jgi:hypothetical protein
MTLYYNIDDVPTETEASIEVCAEDPTPTPDPTNPKPEVDPKPDAAAGAAGPSLGSVLTLLIVSGSGIGFVTYTASKIKKAENLVK